LKATEFEYRHQKLIPQFILAIAFLTYLVDREDVVWRFVKNTAMPHTQERFVFIGAAIFIAVGVGLCTWGSAHRAARGTRNGGPTSLLRHPEYLGDLCYAIGLGTLAPVAGFLVLVGGEALRVFRLARRMDDHEQNSQPQRRPLVAEQVGPNWKKAFRQEAAKWGILVTMTVFVITLQDRHAEVLAVASFLLGILLNAPSLLYSTRHGRFC